VTELGVGAPRQARPSPENPADALGAVLENATALARAEVRLAAAEARAWLIRIGFGLVLLWLALLLIQVAVLVLALSPVLVQASSWSIVGWVLALALVPAVVVTWLAVRELRRAKDMGHAELDKQSELERH
jgi:hypothetical protein